MSIGYIPQEILDEIASKCDIVAVVGEYVPIKRKGVNYQGLCPFHNEKTPSFSVSPSKQIFHCFGCGVGGNVFKFVMDIENLNFIEAVEKLAKRAGVQLPEKELSAGEKRLLQRNERFYQINELTGKYYHKVLTDSKWGKVYLDYLTERGMGQEVIEKFGLGACQTGWDGLYRFLLSREVAPEEMLTLGLVLSRKEGNGYYDRFRERLMFPIRDERGRVVAFGGRVVEKDGSPQKYMNSPDTPLFNKGKHLYGLDVAKSNIRGKDLAVVVEGYMDVISCHQYGVNYAVAPLGTAFTNDQAKLLMRSTYQVAIAFDGDTAGSNATLRSLDILADLGAQVRVVNLPKGLDPDDFLKKHGKEAFDQLIFKSQELIVYKIDRLMENINTDGIAGKMKVLMGVLPDVAKIKSPVAQESAIGIISRRLQVTENAILSELKNYSSGKVYQEKPRVEMAAADKKSKKQLADLKREGQVFKLLFENQSLIKVVEESGGVKLFATEVSRLYEMLQSGYRKNTLVKSGDFSQEDMALLAEVLMSAEMVHDAAKTLNDYIKHWQIEQCECDYQLLLQQLSEAEKMGETEKMLAALQGLEVVRVKKKALETLRKGE